MEPIDEKLPRAGGGGAVWLKAETYEKLRALAERGRVVPDAGDFVVSRREGMTHFRLKNPAAAGAGAAAGPWSPRVAEEGGVWKARIAAGLLRLADGTEQAVADAGDAFTVAAGDVIYLEAAISGAGEVTGVTAMAGSAWAGHPEPTGFSGTSPFAQDFARVELGKVVAAGDALAIEAAWASGHMRIVDAIVNGRLCKIFTPGN